MSTLTIYATGIHKGKEEYTSYCLGFMKGRAKKPKEIIGQFESKSKAESQLNILLYAIQLATEDSEVEEIKVISDLPQIEKITDGTIDLWESDNWLNKKKTIPQAELWQEIFAALQKFDITFSAPQSEDTNMVKIINTAKEGSKKKKNPTPLNVKTSEKNLVEVVAETSKVEENAKEEVATPIKKSDKTPTKKEKVTPPTEEKTTESLTREKTNSPIVSNTKNVGLMPTSNDSSIEIDRELKEKCDILFNEIGLDTKTAINMFLKHSIRQKGLTLDLVLENNE